MAIAMAPLYSLQSGVKSEVPFTKQSSGIATAFLTDSWGPISLTEGLSRLNYRFIFRSPRVPDDSRLSALSSVHSEQYSLLIFNNHLNGIVPAGFTRIREHETGFPGYSHLLAAVIAFCLGKPAIMAEWPVDKSVMIREPNAYRGGAQMSTVRALASSFSPMGTRTFISALPCTMTSTRSYIDLGL